VAAGATLSGRLVPLPEAQHHPLTPPAVAGPAYYHLHSKVASKRIDHMRLHFKSRQRKVMQEDLATILIKLFDKIHC